MESSGRLSLQVLRKRQRDASARTLKAQQQVAERRTERKQKVTAAKKPEEVRAEVPSFELSPSEGKARKDRPLNSTDVMGWFREALQKLYGDALVLPVEKRWWTTADRSMALGLLKKYGATRLRATIEYFVATWPQRLALNEGRTTGIPTLRLLVAMREHIFNEASGAIPMGKYGKGNKKKDPKRRGEYDPAAEPKRGIGWDDD